MPPRQQDRDARATVLDGKAQGCLHFLVFPGTQAIGGDTDCNAAAVLDALLQQILPGQAGTQLFLVEPALEPPLGQGLLECPDGGFVAAVVGQKDIEAGHKQS